MQEAQRTRFGRAGERKAKAASHLTLEEEGMCPLLWREHAKLPVPPLGKAARSLWVLVASVMRDMQDERVWLMEMAAENFTMPQIWTRPHVHLDEICI